MTQSGKGKRKGCNVAEAVRAIAKPIAESLGLELWDVRYVKEGADWFLRIFIDKPEGVGIDDCTAMSRAVDGPLDEMDPIQQAYCLEVCSPGINRQLVRPEHFEAFLGAPVRVKLIRPMEDGTKVLSGVLDDYTPEGAVVLLVDEETSCTIEKKEIVSVCVADDDDLFDE